jgi:hypothetical protein
MTALAGVGGEGLVLDFWSSPSPVKSNAFAVLTALVQVMKDFPGIHPTRARVRAQPPFQSPSLATPPAPACRLADAATIQPRHVAVAVAHGRHGSTSWEQASCSRPIERSRGTGTGKRRPKGPLSRFRRPPKNSATRPECAQGARIQ